MKRKMLSLGVMILFYAFAGVRHFTHPESYYSMMPPYIPFHSVINYIAGVAEILFAILLIFPITRKFAATGIMVMLVVYIPTHIYMIELAPGVWETWVRLFVAQPLLLIWAWWHREDRENPKGILV
ncbi:MAG TPA: MauE/DoxX family redox-associated membrane protein [Ferruginibacter sp.]|nr:MauE/DoxX family redox-associated membrane protein [Ferruginibacter sp.]